MKSIAEYIFAVIIGLIMAILIAEWMMGCGETYVDSKGITHKESCIFVR